MELEEYKTQVQKKHGHKQMKVTNSFGVYDVFKHIRKNGWYDIGRPLKEHEFYTIVRSINNLMAAEIAKGNTVTFPSYMGKLELRKTKRGVTLKDGKLKNTYPVDWAKTIELWYEDEEARDQKLLIRHEVPWVYRVKYCFGSAKFKNKFFYQFVLNRTIKKMLKDNINSQKTDTLW